MTRHEKPWSVSSTTSATATTLGDALGLRARFPVATGPVVLFAGRSGTGKTAAAEAVAAAVGRPLHTVNLAQLVSKYVGETEKHVDEVFAQAQRTSAVLLFDEADTLFSARVENASTAGEQFGNMLVGYLLQRIEQHDGVTIPWPPTCVVASTRRSCDGSSSASSSPCRRTTSAFASGT